MCGTVNLHLSNTVTLYRVVTLHKNFIENLGIKKKMAIFYFQNSAFKTVYMMIM